MTASSPIAANRAATGQPVPATRESARKAGAEFEAMFLSQMLGHIFEGIKTDGAFGGGHAERMYRSLLVDEYGKAMARNGGIGIADKVMNEILRQQEAAKQ